SPSPRTPRSGPGHTCSSAVSWNKRCSGCTEAHQAFCSSIQEMIMRALILGLGLVFLAGCAATPARDTVAVYDHKYNQTYYLTKEQPSEFVGTSAKVANAAPKPAWNAYGHP